MPSRRDSVPFGPAEIAELLDRYAAALELYASQWTTMPADCVQEAFVSLTKHVQQTGEQPEHVAAWLYRAVRNGALNAARADRQRQHHEKIAARLLEEQHADQERSNFLVGEQLPLLEALDSLASEDRELVVLRIWSELTWQQIAELTNTSSSTAQRRYVNVLTKLRQHLEPSCPIE